MITRKSWDEFRETGLLLFVNTFLHIFGWAIVVVLNEDSEHVIEVYPARVKFRGFCEKAQMEAYQKLYKYLLSSINEIAKDIEE